MKIKSGEVKIREEKVTIPTYPAGKPDKNPMFLEKRVYQGSSGKVYPLPVTDKIYDEKIMKEYNMVFLENKYLQIWILPELGGRIQRALDKTNGYDFVYYNRVIKPALVGLAGPWISGGIEFNWPQHHRPGTFSPVEYKLESESDDKKTLWVSETDRMYGTKVTTGFTLYADKAYLEIKSQVYNRTQQPQTFLWWANPAVAVNDKTRTIFPPDVNAVLDHGKRDVSEFPIAKGTYYKVDYSPGTDISMYKNIPVPTSYMAYHSDYDFVGNYDYGKKAGLLHVADHHISPGKKQWTWGNGDFGKAWDRNLTDEDGPYIELMTGVFTDNQPDFTWLNPYEQKDFTQYFMPYKELGEVKNATVNAAVNLEIKENTAHISVYATSLYKDARVEFTGNGFSYINDRVTVSPEEVYTKTVSLRKNEDKASLTVNVISREGKLLVSCKNFIREDPDVPAPAKAIKAPELLESNEDLYLAGMHLEQYRHATYEPDWYYLEGLRRNPEDIRINNAYGKLLFRRGLFKESETYFKRAVDNASRHNTNLYDGEPLYNLGLSLRMQGLKKSSYDVFHKSCWSENTMGKGYFMLGLADIAQGEYEKALEHVEKSLELNIRNYKGRGLKTSVLRKLKNYRQAEEYAFETIKYDPMDFRSYNELYLIYREEGEKEKTRQIKDELIRMMRDDDNNYIELSADYSEGEMYSEAADILKGHIERKKDDVSPMVFYYTGWYEKNQGISSGIKWIEKGNLADMDYCFPNKLTDISVLEYAAELTPDCARPLYYAGNLWYDKKQYEKAVDCWEKSVSTDESNPTAYRNLALAYFNKENNPGKAVQAMEKAFETDKSDARVFLELDQLYKKTGVSPEKRLLNFKVNIEAVNKRDDLYTEYITLLNLAGQYDESLKLMSERNFHPWEGGEGKITTQYALACIGKGKRYLDEKNYVRAGDYFEKSISYPLNLGEGKLYGARENDKYYYLALAFDGMGEKEKAQNFYEKASEGNYEPASAMFYNDQPPEMIFYQGLALEKLGKREQADEKYEKLISYGKEHLEDDVKIDYFAVSLPDFLIFEDDLKRKNKIHCHFLMGLGYTGKGDIKRAREEYEKVLELDRSHQGALLHFENSKKLKG